MHTEPKSWDSSHYLRSPAAIVTYLNAILEDPDASRDPAMIAHALGVAARAKGMTEVARETGLSRESLYKALSENGNPSFATVLKVLQALSVQLRAASADNPDAA